MSLATTYMGLNLTSPVVPSASPLSEEIGNLKRMEDAGAAAVVLHSLFEEQLVLEELELHHRTTQGTQMFQEALTYFPEPEEYKLGPDEYLEHIRKAKEAVEIPIIASLNGSSIGGWTEYAKQMQDAGADALELNIYRIPTDPAVSGNEIEKTYLEILKAVKARVSIPVAVKLSPFFSNMASMAKQLDDAGADALVLFNRFYQPDIDLDELEVSPHILLSTPQALRLPMRWIAILYGRINADLAATSGIHWGRDVIKVIMAGASVAQVCSALLKNGIDHLRVILQAVHEWMEKNEYESIQQMKGSMSQVKCPDPAAFERAQYMRALTTYRPSF